MPSQYPLAGPRATQSTPPVDPLRGNDGDENEEDWGYGDEDAVELGEPDEILDDQEPEPEPGDFWFDHYGDEP